MGVLYNLLMPRRCHMNHDDFSPIDDRPLTSSPTRYCSPPYSETASSSYHTCLLNICRVSYVNNATSQRSLPGAGDQNKTNRAIEKAKDTKNDLLALFGTIVRARSVSYGDIFRDSDIVLKGAIHQSRLDAIKPRLDSAPLEDAATTTAIAGGSEKQERKDSDDDIAQIPIERKEAKRRTRKVTVSVKAHEANGKLSASSIKPGDRPSLFEVARWPDVDWQTACVDPSNATTNCQPSVQPSQAVLEANSTEGQSASLSITSSIEPRSNKPDVDAQGFVSAIQKFNELVGSCDASARFAQNQGHCLANNQRGTRCKSWHGIPVDDRPIVRMLLAELERLNYDSRPSFCVDKLLNFTNLAVCPYQRVEIRQRVADLPHRQSDIPDEKGLVKYLPQIVPYRPPGSAHLTVSEFVMQQAMEPFDVIEDPEKELGEGYLYVYWNEVTSGVRKIGFTTRDVDDRLKDWETKCRRTAKEEYRSPSKVRHAAKIERLVHADLLEYRVRELACRTCLKSHIEWFRGVNLTFIIGRIEAWSQWISEQPYERVGKQWRLTNSGRDSMPVLN